MTRQELIRKLTSRKLWVAVGLILATWLAPDVQAQVQEAVSAVIGVGYMIAEGLADGAKRP